MTSRLLAYRPEMELPEAPGLLPLQQEDELALAAQLLELQWPAQFDAVLARQLLGTVVAPLLPLHGGSPQALKRRAAGIFGMELDTASRRLRHDFQPDLERHMPAITRARVAHLGSPIPEPFDLAQACAVVHEMKNAT